MPYIYLSHLARARYKSPVGNRQEACLVAGLGNGGTGGGGGGVAPPPLPFAPRAFLPGTVGGRGRGTYQIHFPLVGIHDAALAGPLVVFLGGG